MAKQPPTKQPKADLGTYFLAKHSKLFRPGAALILATAPQLRRRPPGPMKARK